MVKADKNIMRGFLVLTYIVSLSVLIFLISSAFTYLNTGADRSSMLHTQIATTNSYMPKMNWISDGNEGRKIDAQTIQKIETDYRNAWYIKNTAFQTNQTTGIADYYTENARKNITDFITQNQQRKISIHATTLSHQPNVEFFSEDGQLVVITDENVVEYKQMYQNGIFITEITETATYKVILLLEDGFWRIRHLIKESIQSPLKTVATAQISNLNLKGLNYYPQATPWNMFGTDFDIHIINNDFKVLQTAGFNTIRIFIPYEDFGGAEVIPEKLQKLKLVLDVAESKQLQVIVTLFDFYGNYAVSDWTQTQRHAETIVSTFKNHAAIVAWDIKNEPNLDFETRGKHTVLAWLKQHISLVKLIDKKHLVTIGWSQPEIADLLQNEVDFVSFHYYDASADFTQKYKTLRGKIANKPIVLGEFGQSSYGGFWKPFAGSETKQATYVEEIKKVLEAENISYLAWTMYDFETIPKAVVGSRPWRTNPQKKFGILDTDGNKKEVFAIFEE